VTHVLTSNTGGAQNTAIGANALESDTNGTAVGRFALHNSTSGDFKIALGHGAGGNVTTPSKVICIGSDGANVTQSCFISNNRGVTTAQNDAVPVVIDSAGQLGTQSSSRRYKKDNVSMEKNSEAILALKRVAFHYKSDNTNRAEFGLIAEDVAQLNPELIVRDADGEVYTVRYEGVNAMLLNEFLKRASEKRRNRKPLSRGSKSKLMR